MPRGYQGDVWECPLAGKRACQTLPTPWSRHDDSLFSVCCVCRRHACPHGGQRRGGIIRFSGMIVEPTRCQASPSREAARTTPRIVCAAAAGRAATATDSVVKVSTKALQPLPGRAVRAMCRTGWSHWSICDAMRAAVARPARALNAPDQIRPRISTAGSTSAS